MLESAWEFCFWFCFWTGFVVSAGILYAAVNAARRIWSLEKTLKVRLIAKGPLGIRPFSPLDQRSFDLLVNGFFFKLRKLRRKPLPEESSALRKALVYNSMFMGALAVVWLQIVLLIAYSLVKALVLG